MNICIWADDIPSSSLHFSQFMGLSENRVPTDLFYQCMEVSSNGGTPKSSKSLDHVSIETNGFGDPPFQDATRHIYPVVNQHNYGKSPFFMGKSTISMAIFNVANC